MNKLKAKTKRELIEILKSIQGIPHKKEKYNEVIAELEALETEPRFKKSELLMFWDADEKLGAYKEFSRLSNNGFISEYGIEWNNACRITRWQEYKGVTPELPEGANGWQVKYDDNSVKTIPKSDIGEFFSDSIIEYAIWYKP